MRREPRRGIGRRIGPVLACGFLALVGCTDVTVRTTLDPDGGGRRWEEVRVAHGSDAELPVSHDAYVYLMGVGPERGWTHASRVRGEPVEGPRPTEADSVHLFRREHRLRNLADWSRLDGTLRIRGTTEAHAGVRVGDAVLGDARFENRVRVGRGTTSDGRRTLTYRETFSWVGGLDPLIQYLARDVADTLATLYGEMTPERRGELIGLVRGGLWAAVDRGLLVGRDQVDEDALLDDFVRRTAEEVVKSFPGETPEARRSVIEAALRSRLGDEGSWSAWADRVYPGFGLATSTSIEFRLRMPGRVTFSNADDVQGDTLVWTFGPEHALAWPFEIHAESIM